jgi:zinc protease
VTVSGRNISRNELTPTPDRRQRPSPQPLVSFRLPEIRKERLTNGLELWMISRPDVRIVYASVILQCGAVADPTGLAGTAAMTADLLDTGTSRMDALTISGELERLGSSLKIRAGYDGTSMGLNCLSRNTRASFDILGELLEDPAFSSAELERLRSQRLAAILQQKDKPAAVASLALYRIIYGSDHPYGNDPDGTEQSIRSMSRDDLLRFFNTHYHASAATMVVVGDVDDRAFDSLLDGVTKRWNGQSAGMELKVPSGGDNPRLLVVDRPDAPQSEIRIGCPGLRRNAPEFFPSVVMNRILGGNFSSRMNANLREKRGFTYGAWTSFSYGKFAGPFVGGAAVQTQHTGETVREIFLEIDAMRRSGITAAELAFARRGIEGGFALMFESPAQVISIMQNLVLYDLPVDYYASYLDNMRKVSQDDVMNVAGKLLDPASMSLVVVGDAKTVVPQLEGIELRNIEVTEVESLGL